MSWAFASVVVLLTLVIGSYRSRKLGPPWSETAWPHLALAVAVWLYGNILIASL